MQKQCLTFLGQGERKGELGGMRKQGKKTAPIGSCKSNFPSLLGNYEKPSADQQTDRPTDR